MINDISIFETGQGGDIYINGNDVELTSGLFNFVYLALFGGNVEEENRLEDQSRLLRRRDYWANDLLYQNQPEVQFVSSTERILRSVALTSQGRARIEAAVLKDLEVLSEVLTVVSVDVFVTGNDRAQIDIVVEQKDSTQNQEFKFIWDGARLEVVRNDLVGDIET